MPTLKRPRPKKNAEISFPAAFTGEAVDSGRISAKLLAPSLLATAELVESSATAIFPSKNPVTVQVAANFRKGSFQYQLVAVAVGGFVASGGATLLQNLSIQDIETMLRSIGLMRSRRKNYIDVAREVAGGKIERIEVHPGGTVNLIVNHGDNATNIIGDVPKEVGSLLRSESVRDALPGVLEPLNHEGIDTYRVGPRSRPQLIVKKEHMQALGHPLNVRSQLTENVGETALELLAPSFVDGNKWKVSQGGAQFWVTIEDPEFIQTVDDGVRSFAKGDYLIVELRTRTFETAEGLEPEFAVVRVMQHKSRSHQLRLSV